MLSKFLFKCIITFFILNMSSTLEAQEKKISKKNSLINKFCIASLKSELGIKDKQNLNEISNFTCECFLKKYKSGSSMKSSRVYCKNKTADHFKITLSAVDELNYPTVVIRSNSDPGSVSMKSIFKKFKFTNKKIRYFENIPEAI